MPADGFQRTVTFFYSESHRVQSPEFIRCRGFESKRHILCCYVGDMTVNPNLEQVKIIVIGKAISWESV